MRLYALVEERLLRSMAFVGGVTKSILAWRQHTGSTPTSAVLKSYTVKQSVQASVERRQRLASPGALLLGKHIALERLQVARLKIAQLIDVELVH